MLLRFSTIGGLRYYPKAEGVRWGVKVIDQFSIDLQKRYGGGSDFSERNLGYMKSIAAEYPTSHFFKYRLQNYERRLFSGETCKIYDFATSTLDLPPQTHALHH